MNGSDFTTASLLGGQGIYALTKGDLLGHIFHGNQWQQGESLGAEKLGRLASEKYLQPRHVVAIKEGHEALAHQHIEKANRFDEIARQTVRATSEQRAAAKATAQAHRDAAWAHKDAAAKWGIGVVGKPEQQIAARGSQSAARLSARADSLGS